MSTRSLRNLRRAGGAAAMASLLALGACGDETPRAEPDCSSAGRACTWLGIAGQDGFSGDGHHRLETKLYWTMDMRFASDGTPWFIDWNNHLVRRVLPDDTVETIVGWIDPVFPGDGGPEEQTEDGAIGTAVQLNHPTDLAELPDGRILVMAWHNHKLRAIDPVTRRVKILSGKGAGYAGDGLPAARALYRQPKALEVDAEGNMYILDQQNFRIRRIGADGMVRTIAGAGMPGMSGDGGPALEAKFGFEAGSNPEPSGGLALRDGRLYVADTLNSKIRVIDLATNIITTIAGTGEAGFSGDGGPAMQAQLHHPRDIEFGPDGALYIADTDNSRIRSLDLSTGVIRTVAGTGEFGLDPEEGKLATETTLRRPFGVEFDREGNLYISDTINSRIVRVAK